jgi:endo-1,3(4)-beta-glucanase
MQKVEIAAIQMLPVTPINEYLYDSAWVQNVYSYASNELTNSSYSDDWKSVIYCAYSEYDPHTAAQLSSDLTSWGSGNSFTNQVYFLSTRPNTDGTTCTSLANPLGNFTLQVSGKYVVASSANPSLVANATSASAAAVFDIAFAPNGGTIQLLSTGQFVTADQSGSYALSASRAAASTWETYVIRQKQGAASDVYTIRADSNGLYVTVGMDGSLFNNGSTEASGAPFSFIAA